MIDLLVDGVNLSAPSALRGLGTYLRGITERLAQRPDFSVKVLVVGTVELPHPVEPVEVERRLPPALQLLEQSARLGRDIQRADASVFHSPALDPPLRSPVPWVQTLHDVIPLAVPHLGPLRRSLWRVRAPRMRKASAVIAVSRHTADDGIRRLGIDPAKVHVIHHGVDPAFSPPATRTEVAVPFVLMVSGYSAQKGFAEAFAVMAELAAAGHPHRLRVVGAMPARATEHLEALARRAGVPERVELLGHVATTELIRLYQQASLLLVTSRYEGFCFPAVEAMASGTPVVAFANSALPEVVGDGGLLVPDGDVTAFAATSARVLADPDLAIELSEAAVKRATAFDWDRSADEHAEVFRAVAGG